MKHPLIMVLAGTLLATPALAEDPIRVVANAPEPTAVIYYGDLDMARQAGLDALNGRVKKAARAICLPQLNDPTREWVRQTECYKTARADGYAQAEALHAASMRGEVLVGAFTLTGQ